MTRIQQGVQHPQHPLLRHLLLHLNMSGRPQPYTPTDQETWTRSDRYHNARLIGTSDPSLAHTVDTSATAGLPNIAVSEAQVCVAVSVLKASAICFVIVCNGC